MAICKRDWHFKLGTEEKTVYFTTQPTANSSKSTKWATYHKTFRESFSEGAGEASSTLFSTNLRAEEDGRRFVVRLGAS